MFSFLLVLIALLAIVFSIRLFHLYLTILYNLSEILKVY